MSPSSTHVQDSLKQRCFRLALTGWQTSCLYAFQDHFYYRINAFFRWWVMDVPSRFLGFTIHSYRMEGSPYDQQKYQPLSLTLHSTEKHLSNYLWRLAEYIGILSICKCREKSKVFILWDHYHRIEAGYPQPWIKCSIPVSLTSTIQNIVTTCNISRTVSDFQLQNMTMFWRTSIKECWMSCSPSPILEQKVESYRVHSQYIHIHHISIFLVPTAVDLNSNYISEVVARSILHKKRRRP